MPLSDSNWKKIGKFQGVSFKLADLITEIDAADWLTLVPRGGDEGLPANRGSASAKLYATEMLARVTDKPSRFMAGWGLWMICHWRGSGVMQGLKGFGTAPRKQRHIISRDLLRPLGG